MDIVEKFNRNFGTWFERLFGTQDPAGPRDVLRRVISSMESARREGLDGNIYVPNQVTVSLTMVDTDELDALAMFLNEPDLHVAINEFIAQEGYRLKNPLSVTVKTHTLPEQSGELPPREAVEISCRYSNEVSKVVAPPASDELHTVAAGFLNAEAQFNAISGYLVFRGADGGERRIAVSQGGVRIGRSRSAGNTIVLPDDTQVSRSHAVVATGQDNRTYIEDLGSLNGTLLNGIKVSKSPLTYGDLISIGSTDIRFNATGTEEQGTNLKIIGTFGGAAAEGASAGSGPLPPSRIMRPAAACLVACGDFHTNERFYLASDNVIGRSPTCDIVLPSRVVAMRHARITKQDHSFFVEKLDNQAVLEVDGVPVSPVNLVRVPNGSMLMVGDIMLRLDGEGA